MTAVYRRAALR